MVDGCEFSNIQNLGVTPLEEEEKGPDGIVPDEPVFDLCVESPPTNTCAPHADPPVGSLLELPLGPQAHAGDDSACSPEDLIMQRFNATVVENSMMTIPENKPN